MFFTRDKNFYKSLIRLAIPISLQNAVTFAVNLADNLMIGSLGDSAISGVYVGSQIQTVLQTFVAGIEGAILILAAQYWGKRDTGSIRKIAAIGVRIALATGVLFTLAAFILPGPILRIFTDDPVVIEAGIPYLRIVSLSYLFFCISQVMVAVMRSVETAKIGLYVSFVTLGVNVSLNYILIFGKLGFPKMGVTGAAVATLVSRVIEAAVMVIYVRFSDKKLAFRLSDLKKRDRLLLRDFIRYGMPVVGGQLVWAANLMGQTMILGRFNAGVITAASIAGMLNNLIYVWMTGFSNAVGIITGKTVGSGDLSGIREYSRTVQVIFLVIGFISGLTVFFLRNWFIGLYNTSPEAAACAREFILVLSVTIVGTCYQAACLFGLVKSGGDISFVFKNDAIFVFLVVLPSAVLAAYLGAPAWVVFACLKSDQILKCFVAVVKINRYNWMKNLTREETPAAS